MVGKTRNLKKFSDTHKAPEDRRREPKSFGEIVTMDHVSMGDGIGARGLSGYTDMLTFLDLATGFRYAEPCRSKDSSEVYDTLHFLKSNRKFGLVYSDNFPSLIRACADLRVLHEGSQPGMPQTNGRIERCNGDLLEGTRACLAHAGLPSCFWPWAVQCYAFLSNIADSDDKESPWTMIHGTEFPGLQIPFGARVYFKPSPTKYTLDKAAGRLQCGIMVGYRMAPGIRWKGEYLVVDLMDFVGKMLHESAPSGEFSITPPCDEGGQTP